jgi:hypothetical protein
MSIKNSSQQLAVSSQPVFEMGILPHLKKIPPIEAGEFNPELAN